MALGRTGKPESCIERRPRREGLRPEADASAGRVLSCRAAFRLPPSPFCLLPSASRWPGPVETAGACSVLPGAIWQLTWPSRCLESVPVPENRISHRPFRHPAAAGACFPQSGEGPLDRPHRPPCPIRCAGDSSPITRNTFNLNYYADLPDKVLTDLKSQNGTRTMPIYKPAIDPPTLRWAATLILIPSYA